MWWVGYGGASLPNWALPNRSSIHSGGTVVARQQHWPEPPMNSTTNHQRRQRTPVSKQKAFPGLCLLAFPCGTSYVLVLKDVRGQDRIRAADVRLQPPEEGQVVRRQMLWMLAWDARQTRVGRGRIGATLLPVRVTRTLCW